MWKFIICVVFVLELSVLPDVTLAQSDPPSAASPGASGATPAGTAPSGGGSVIGCFQCILLKDAQAKCDPQPLSCDPPDSALGKKRAAELKDLVTAVPAVAEAVTPGLQTCAKITYKDTTYTGCLKDPAATCADVRKQQGSACDECKGEACNLSAVPSSSTAAQTEAATVPPTAAASSEAPATEASTETPAPETTTEAANTSNATNKTEEGKNGSVNYYANLWIYQLMVVATIKLLFL